MQNKKEIINEYKNRKQIGGICKITNTKTGKIFVFTVPDLEAGRNRFEFNKRTGSGINLKLKRDWDIYGSESFIFEVLEELEKSSEQSIKEFNEDLNELLDIYMQKYTNKEMY